jgi:hypothetical protein
MTTMIDEFDLDVRLGEPLEPGSGLVASGPRTDDPCVDSHHVSCGTQCPTCPSVSPRCQ